MKFRHPRTRAYDSLPAQIAMRKALEPVTPKEVRNMLAIGLKSEDELHPDFPATGELSGGVESRHADRTEQCQVRTGVGIDRSATDPEQEQGGHDSLSRNSARPAQQPLLNLNHVFSEVGRRFSL